MDFGKRLYHSTGILTIKLLAALISSILFLNLNFQTLVSEHFNSFVMEEGLDSAGKFWQVLQYHMVYPEEYIFFAVTVLLPAIYYGFIRGVTFYQKGVSINRGLPFFKMSVPYDQIKNYEIIHPKFFLAITHKETGDDIMFTVNDVDRVLAILDQFGIQGDLGKKARIDHGAHVKLLLFFIFSGVLMALVQYSGWIRSLFD